MRAISIQVQPERAGGIDMAAVQSAFGAIAQRQDLVLHHDFSDGEDQGRYFNFTFGTPAPSLLWSHIWSFVYESPDLGRYMKASSMAMCSSNEGWDTYTQLYHFDPEVPCEAV